MRVMQMVTHVNTYKGYGVTIDQLKKTLIEEEEEDIKRLVTAAVELGEIKKLGVGRSQKYYGIEFEPIISNAVPKVQDCHLIDGKIDVSKCVNTKEKIATILASDHPLSQPIVLQYRERLLETPTNRDLKDFINDGVVDVDVKIYFDNVKKQNVIYSKQVKPKYNTITIGKIDGKLTVTKAFNGSSENTEIKEFENWQVFEKYLRTLLSK